MTPFELVDEFEAEMTFAWEMFKAKYPDVGQSHEKVFRFAYTKSWDDCERYWRSKLKSVLNEKDSR